MNYEGDMIEKNKGKLLRITEYTLCSQLLVTKKQKTNREQQPAQLLHQSRGVKTQLPGNDTVNMQTG